MNNRMLLRYVDFTRSDFSSGVSKVETWKNFPLKNNSEYRISGWHGILQIAIRQWGGEEQRPRRADVTSFCIASISAFSRSISKRSIWISASRGSGWGIPLKVMSGGPNSSSKSVSIKLPMAGWWQCTNTIGCALCLRTRATRWLSARTIPISTQAQFRSNFVETRDRIEKTFFVSGVVTVGGARSFAPNSRSRYGFTISTATRAAFRPYMICVWAGETQQILVTNQELVRNCELFVQRVGASHSIGCNYWYFLVVKSHMQGLLATNQRGRLYAGTRIKLRSMKLHRLLLDVRAFQQFLKWE